MSSKILDDMCDVMRRRHYSISRSSAILLRIRCKSRFTVFLFELAKRAMVYSIVLELRRISK